MNRYLALALFVVPLFLMESTPARAVPGLDLRALSLARQADALRSEAVNGALRGKAQIDRRRALLRAAAELELGAESGRASISPAVSAQLLGAIDALSDVPVVVTAAPGLAKANGTISGTVFDAATMLPVTTAGSVLVLATDFSSFLTPSGAGVVNNVGIDASGNFTLSLPPGNYQVRTSYNSLGYINQAFGFGNCVDNQACPRNVGTIVAVPDGGAAPTVNFQMPAGGAISGIVTRSDTNAALSGILVFADSESGFSSPGVNSDGSGNFTIAGLAPGRYRVYAISLIDGLLSEIWNNVSCGRIDCLYVPGSALVTVAGTATTGGVNFSLDPGAGSLSGVITETGTGTPIVDGGGFTAIAVLISEDRATYFSTLLGAGGSYSFTGLRPGNYRLAAMASGYIGKVVTATAPVITTRDCNDPVDCDALDTGGVIAIAPSAALTGLNFSLDRGATFSGNVRTAVGAIPIAGATVAVSNSVNAASATTDALGNFVVRGLPAGVYYANVDAEGQNFVTTWLGDVACKGLSCVNLGIPVTLAANATVSGQQFNMPVGGTLAGVIIDGATGFPAPPLTRIDLFDSAGQFVFAQPTTDASGYRVTGLQPGAYRAVFASSSVVGWVDTAFGGLPCPRGGCDLSLLPTVYVTAGATTSGVGATLPRGPRILGRVTDAATGEPVSPLAFDLRPQWRGQFIALYNNLSNYAGFGRIDRAGLYYSRTGLSPGPYFASTFLLRSNTPIGGGYVDQLYDNFPCPYGSCGLTTGTPINVTATDVGGINIALSQGGAISGTVSNAIGAMPLFGVQVRAYNTAGLLVAVARSNPNGKYRLDGLPAGSYFLTTQNELGFQDQLYNGQSCEPFCNPVTGTAVVVTGTATTSGRNFSLVQSVTVSGTVTNGGPAANVAVEIYGQIGNLLRSTVTNSAGNFLFADLAPGRFYVRTRNAIGRTDDLYYDPANPNNTSPTKPDCVGLACQVRAGSPIDLGAGGSFSLANLALQPPGVISGQVTNFATSGPMSGVSLQLLDARGAIVGTQTSSASGNYSFSALATGSYYLVSRGTPGFVDLSYPNVSCPASCDGLNGSTIAVTAGATTSAINLVLTNGASISGTVRNAVGSLPIAGTTVQVYNSSAVPVAQIATNPSGNYELSNVANGNVFVRTQNSLGFINEVFNNRPCGGYCDILSGNAVVISAGVSVGLVDFFLDAGGSISGRITNSATSAGIALAEVQALDVNGLIAGRSNTDASGNYTIGGLQPGSYKLRTSNTAGFTNQVYRTPTPLTCSPGPCLPSAGTAVTVAGAVPNINMALAPGGTISGTAADLFNNPLPSGTAVLLDVNAIELLANPIVNGLFEFNGLANGTYYVLIRNTSGLIDLLYPNVPCPAGACNITAVGTPIVLAALRAPGAIQAVANIDLRLPTGRAIAGRVTSGSTPIVGATVYVYNSTGAVVGTGVTDALGDYVTSGSLPAGTGINYFVATTSPTSRGATAGLVNKVWNNIPCMLNCGVTTVGTAIALAQAPAPLSGINFNLQAGGAISGTVRNASAAPLALVTVQIVDAAGRVVGTAQSNSQGSYSVDGLLPGNYFARTINVLSLDDRIFGGGICGTGCNPLTGTPIAVSGTATTPGIDFTLSLPDLLFGNGFE